MARYAVYIAPFLFVFLWATGFVGARLGMPHSEPGTFLAIRFASAFVLLALAAVFFKARWPERLFALHAVIIGFLIHGVYLGGVFWAIDRGMPAGVAAIIVGLQPLLTALLAGWFLGEVISVKHWIGIVFGTVGVALVVAPGLDLTGSGITPLTVAVAFLAMVSVTLGTIYQKAVGSQMDLRTGVALQYVGAFIPVFLFAWFAETGQIDWNGEMITSMVWAATVLSVGMIFLLMWLIRQGSVARVSTLFFLVPAVASLMAYALFDEALTLLQIAGMALCGLAVALAAPKPDAAK